MAQSNAPSSSNRCLFTGLIGCGILLALSVVGVVLFFVWLGFQPEGGVRMANQLEDYAVEYLDQNPVLNDTEKLIAYYDVTISLDGTDAVILTNERLIHHKAEREDVALKLTEIDGFTHHEESVIGDIFQVDGKDGTIMKFEIAIFNDGQSFKSALERQLELASSPPPEG